MTRLSFRQRQSAQLSARSEQKFHAELDLAVGCNRGRDVSSGSHCSARSCEHGTVSDRRREIGVVEDVIKLGPELDVHPVGVAFDVGCLHGRKIE